VLFINGMSGVCGRNELRGGGAHWVLLGKPEGKTPLGRLCRRWVGNIKMDLKEICWGVDWIDRNLDRDR
jgi:hypothetical protein